MKKDWKLEDLPKANLYRAPEGYFEKLPPMIMNRVTAEKPTFWDSWLSSLSHRYQTAFASLLLLISFVAAFLFSQNQMGIGFAGLAAISEQDALEYVLLQDDEIDSGDLVELSLADTDLSADFIDATPAEILETIDEQQLELENN